MASATTISAWSEQLVRSLLPDQTPRLKVRRSLDHFNRTLKHHNYARTNQFEIQERLSGLEEKFQVLNQAELSDALHQRRSELTPHQDRWIPDALDFLLHLSHHPLKYAQLESLNVPEEQSAVSASLKWSDIEADDPIDRQSRIWKFPDYSDFSSDDDDMPSSIDTSPEKQVKVIKKGSLPPKSALQAAADPDLVQKFRNGLFWTREGQVTASESQVLREVMFMVQGYPTSLFKQVDGRILPNTNLKLANISEASLESVLSSVAAIAEAAHDVRQFATSLQKLPFMQVLGDNIGQIQKAFYDNVTELQSQHIRNASGGGVISLLKMAEQLRRTSKSLLETRMFVQEAKNQDAVGHLDILFDHVCRLQHIGDSDESRALMNVFKQTFKTYCQQVDGWIEHGATSETTSPFFVSKVADQRDRAQLWQSWYAYTKSGLNRPPKFLLPFAEQILTCGKTVALTNMLSAPPSSATSLSIGSVIDTATTASRSSLSSFASTFPALLSEHINARLQAATRTLQSTLQQKCNLTSTLHALCDLYLSASPLSTIIVDTHLFSRLDHGQPIWNDRFLVFDLLSSNNTTTSLDTDRITVHSEPTPASTLITARRSVDVLSKIALDYLLPWPIANILHPDTLASYRRVFLLLTQIRRAKYVLERRAYLRLRHFSKSSIYTTLSRRFTGLYTTLLAFCTILHSHLTSCVVSPLTQRLHTAIATSSWTIDDLIALHAVYLRTLEFSCFTTKSLKVLRETVIALLDLCVEFGFMLSDLPKPDDEERDTQGVNDNMVRMGEKFRKQLDFLVAGLRGVGRSNAAGVGDGGEWAGAGEMMELLADGLESGLVVRRR